MENNGEAQSLEQTGRLEDKAFQVFQLLPIPRKFRQAEAEVNLWRAVMDRALKDILDDNEDAPQARGWFRGVKSIWEEVNGWQAGFADVCDMACLDPHWVRDWTSEYLSSRGMSL